MTVSMATVYMVTVSMVTVYGYTYYRKDCKPFRFIASYLPLNVCTLAGEMVLSTKLPYLSGTCGLGRSDKIRSTEVNIVGEMCEWMHTCV